MQTRKSEEKPSIKKHAKNHISGFRDFIKDQGVIGLAIGLVLGGATTVLVNSLINNLIMPPLGFILGSSDGLKGLSFNLGTTPAGEEAVLYYGAFLNDLINFLVIAAVIYFIVKLIGPELSKKKKS